MYLFVYGSLRRDFPMHEALGLHTYAKFLRSVELPGYRMYDLGAYPGVVSDPDGRIQTEQYEVIEHSVIQLLDEYEGFNVKNPEKSLFRRRIVWAWSRPLGYIYVYNRPVDNSPVVENGDWCGHLKRSSRC